MLVLSSVVFDTGRIKADDKTFSKLEKIMTEIVCSVEVDQWHQRTAKLYQWNVQIMSLTQNLFYVI